MAMSSPASGFQARTQRRQNLELSMLRRPSETPSNNTVGTSVNSESVREASPSSPQSSVSTNASSIVEHFDKLQAMQLQLRNNTAQIEANEARMREIQATDDYMGAQIHERLSIVMEVNRQLNRMHAMLARADKVAKGELEATS